MTESELKELRSFRRAKKNGHLKRKYRKRYRVLRRKFRREATAEQKRGEKLRDRFNKVAWKMGRPDPAPRVTDPHAIPPKRHIDLGLPIKDEVLLAHKQRKKDAKKFEPESFGPDLLRLFNVEWVEWTKTGKDGKMFVYVRKTPDKGLLPQFGPKQATHKLVPTMWAEEDVKRTREQIPDRETRTNKKGKVTTVGYEGFAHAVALIPLHRHVPEVKLKIKHPLSRWSHKWPPYKTEWDISKKYRSLLEYARITGVFRKLKKRITLMDHKACDAMLKDFIKASRWLRQERSKDPKNKAFWKKYKRKNKKESKAVVKVQAPKGFLDHFNENERKIIGEALTEHMRRRQVR